MCRDSRPLPPYAGREDSPVAAVRTNAPKKDKTETNHLEDCSRGVPRPGSCGCQPHLCSIAVTYGAVAPERRPIIVQQEGRVGVRERP